MRAWRLALVSISAFLAACVGGREEGEKRFPTSGDYPPGTMERFTFAAGGDKKWKLSALRTPNADAPWRLVVITGTPSWSEYWAPTLAKAPADLQVIVADRPGFAQSEPLEAVPDIEAQAEALSALLDAPEGQRVVLVGQSYGAPVATLLAAKRPDEVKALVLMSSFYGEWGPTAKRLSTAGGLVKNLLPRDLRNSLVEIRNQRPQLGKAEAALAALEIPILVLHGDKDDFVPSAFAETLAAKAGLRAEAETVIVAGGDHFLNACCVGDILKAVDRVIARAEARRPGLAQASLSTSP